MTLHLCRSAEHPPPVLLRGQLWLRLRFHVVSDTPGAVCLRGPRRSPRPVEPEQRHGGRRRLRPESRPSRSSGWKLWSVHRPVAEKISVCMYFVLQLAAIKRVNVTSIQFSYSVVCLRFPLPVCLWTELQRWTVSDGPTLARRSPPGTRRARCRSSTSARWVLLSDALAICLWDHLPLFGLG